MTTAVIGTIDKAANLSKSAPAAICELRKRGPRFANKQSNHMQKSSLHSNFSRINSSVPFPVTAPRVQPSLEQ
jgi:hypothetical protein